MVTKSIDNMFWGDASLLVDAFGTFPVTDMGHKQRDNGVTFTFGRVQAEKRVAELQGPVIVRTIDREARVGTILDQFAVGNLAKALGINSATLLIGGGLYIDDMFAVRIVGTLNDETTALHLYMPKCVTVDDVEFVMQVGESSGLPIAFRALDVTTTGMARWQVGEASEQALTIATGSVTRVAVSNSYEIAQLSIAGEGAVADELDDIAGSSLVQDEIARVMITSAAEPITIVHAGGVIETKDAANFVMNNVKDWIDLYYDLANTTWKEIERYEAL